MTFGTVWGWGSDKETSRAILDGYVEKGGNFVDAANYYTDGESESFLGEFMEGRRDQFVVSSKYSFSAWLSATYPPGKSLSSTSTPKTAR